MSEIQRISDLQRAMNEAREARWRFLLEYHGGVLPPASHKLRVKQAVRRRVYRLRDRLARFIEPD